jgi:ABC-2 type transport system permease protein
MQQFKALFLKEWRDTVRSFKILWIPLVFLLLGVSDPLVNYFMDDIMKSVGNMPDGFTMTMPEFQPADLLAASTGQFQSIGIIVFIAAYIGAFSRERQNGTATLLYVRPISFTSLFLSKWLVASIVAVISVVAGYAGSMYYTGLLYGTVDWMKLFAMVGTYLVWAIFVMAFTLAMSAAFSTTIAATIAIVVLPIGLLIDSLIGGFWNVTPWKLANHGLALLTDSVEMGDYWWTFVVVVICIIISAVVAIVMSKKRQNLLKV